VDKYHPTFQKKTLLFHLLTRTNYFWKASFKTNAYMHC